jgi:hypothetical protein
MRRIASLAVALAGLTVTALPGRADDQAIGYATGLIGGAPAWANYQQAQTTRRPDRAAQRAAPSSYGSYAQDGGYAQGSCSYAGAPRISTTWTCQ